MFKLFKKKVDINEIKEIIILCRSLGVQELAVDKIHIRFFSKANSDFIPLMDNVKVTQSPLLTSPIKPNDKDFSIDDDVLICENPSEYMRKVEKGELSLDKNFGNRPGEEI